MPVTQVGAIYATVSKLLQRVYIPHGDDSEIDKQQVVAGETLAKVPIETYRSGGPPAVQQAIGQPTFSGRCAVVDNNTNLVVDAIIADPVLYSDPRGQIIPNDHAGVGDQWVGPNAMFTRRYAELNPRAPNVFTSVVAVSFQNIATAAPATAGNVLLASTTLNVGSPIPVALYIALKALAG